MKIHQWEVWKTRPARFEVDHWFMIISGPERCDGPRQLMVNGLACSTLRGGLRKSEVQLNGADNFSAPTACQCDFVYCLETAKLHSGQVQVYQTAINRDASSSGAVTIASWPASRVVNDQVLSPLIRLWSGRSVG